MRQIEEELAYEILLRDGVWGMTGCLEEAKACIALRGHDALDDLTQLHVRALALMCSGMKWKDSNIVIHFSESKSVMDEKLEALLEVGYAEWIGTEYRATKAGKEVVWKIGVEMVGMDRFRMAGALQKTEQLLNKIKVQSGAA